jgi:hypothetical protein
MEADRRVAVTLVLVPIKRDRRHQLGTLEGGGTMIWLMSPVTMTKSLILS